MHQLPDCAALVATGRTEAGSAVIWTRMPEPGSYRLLLTGPEGETEHRFTVDENDWGDFIRVIHVPRDLPGARPLTPGTAYRYRITDPEGRVDLGHGAFETSPERGETPERFGIGVLSCHQPFAADGTTNDTAIRMLSHLEQMFARESVKRVLMVGDQMYTDYPPSLSLFNEQFMRKKMGVGSILECDPHAMRRILDRRFRSFWSLPAFARAQADRPCYMVPDDHEWIDNWASTPEHETSRWQIYGKAARDACHAYEMSRMGLAADEPFYFSFEYGPVAAFVMDLRTEKHASHDTTQMFSDAQYEALRTYLTNYGHYPVMMVALSVPLFHVPDWLGGTLGRMLPEGNDMQDRWSYPNVRPCRDRLLGLLAAHHRRCPEQLMILPGGDVHVGLVARLAWRSGGAAYQLVSSALSNDESDVAQWLSAGVGRLERPLVTESDDLVGRVEIMSGHGDARRNPCPQLNAGVVAFQRVARGWEVRLKLYSYDPDAPARLVVAFESRPLVTAIA